MSVMRGWCFTDRDREELTDRVEKAIGNSQFDAVLAMGPPNITYLTADVALPFAEQNQTFQTGVLKTADGAADVLVCPKDLEQVILDQGWQREVRTYGLEHSLPPGDFVQALAGVLDDRGLGGARIGVDYTYASQAVLSQLEAAAPAVRWGNADSLLRDLRCVKTEAEIRLLEIAARVAERAFVSALNHAEGGILDKMGYLLWEFSERIRVHVGEFGGSGTGHLMTAQGGTIRLLYGIPEKHERFRSGELVRSEWTCHHYGYWASCGRTVTAGEPDARQRQAYADNLELKKTVVDALKAGTLCCDIYKATVKAAEKMGIDLWKDPGLGYGVGTSEWEAPFIGANDITMLEPGMILVVAVYTRGPDGELLCSKDTYAITDQNPRQLSWYKNYDELYGMYGSTARHG
jgi:Xaa-Pro aminopeptidase